MHVVVGTAAAVGNGRVEGRCHAGDLEALGHAAGDDGIGLDDIDGAGHQHVAEAVGLAFILPGAQGNGGTPAHIGEQPHIVLHDGFFEAGHVQGLQPPGQFDGVGKIEPATGIDRYLDIRADGLAHGGHAADVLVDGFGQWSGAIAPVEPGPADLHLHRAIALGHHDTAGVGELVAIEKGKTACGVGFDTVAGAADQFPDRLAQGLPLDVPKGEIDGGDGVAALARLAPWGQRPVEHLPDPLMGHGIGADDGRSGDIVDHLGDDRALGDRGEAVADDAVFGLHLGEAHGIRPRAVVAEFGKFHGHGDRRGLHSGDFSVHDFPPLSAFYGRRPISAGAAAAFGWRPC